MFVQNSTFIPCKRSTQSPKTWKESDQLTAFATEQQKHKIRVKRIEMMNTPELCEIFGTPTTSSAKTKSTTTPSLSEMIDLPLIKHNLNEMLVLMGLSKLDEKKMHNRNYKEEMLMKTYKALAKYVFDGVELEKDEIIPQFKAKFEQTINRREKVEILSCLPNSWNPYKVSKTFNVSYHMAQKTKDMVKSNGILFNISKKPGTRTLPDRTIEMVKTFYRSDEISRACSGMRDYIMHSEKGERVTIQRRMILVNLREAYEIFKSKYENEKVGFSKFASIRPPECVLAMEKYGTHTTCVCCYHQNVKLTIDSLKQNGVLANLSHYRDYIELMLCNEDKRTSNCHLNSCEICPGRKDAVGMFLTGLEDSMIEEFTCKQWLNMNGKQSDELMINLFRV